jgi:hypothetical protein
MGETRVDLLHLLEDLRDAYPASIEETILTEIVANSLDSGAARICLDTDPAGATLTVTDDGSGMAKRELARYHDLAASAKQRGEGIGFAGVGIKLGLLVCEQVLTETRRGATHVATRWALASRHRAPWRWVEPPGLVAERGTGVRLKLSNPLSPLLDGGFVEGVLRRHFQPLLDAAFDEILAGHYPRGVRFEVNGAMLAREGHVAPARQPIAIRLARRKKPSAAGYLLRDDVALAEERRGLAISTLGKVIKRGWDWLGVTPAAPELVCGLVEVPDLAGSLTLNKGDFLKTGARGALYLAYRKAIQGAVSAQLKAWGDGHDPTKLDRRRLARPLELDLEAVLGELAEEFPLLSALVERRAGGQQRLPVGRPTAAVAGLAPRGTATAAKGLEDHDESAAAERLDSSDRSDLHPPRSPEASIAGGTALPGSRGPRRPGRYGLTIQFEARPDDLELARLAESTVWINEAHAAYRRAAASRSEGYHLALAVAMALAPLAVEPREEHAFVSAFLARWGEALTRDGRRRRR